MKSRNNTVKINKYFILAIVFLFGTVVIKLLYVAITHNVDGINLRVFAESRDTAKKTLYANRGTIYDISGEVLSQNVNSYTVIAFLSEKRTTNKNNPQHVVDKEYTAEVLYKIFNKNIKTNKMTKEDILKLLSQDNLYQVELGPSGRGITELVKEEIAAAELPGISFISSTKRYYQMGNFASYILGYAKKNDDGEILGEMGIEKYYNEELKGTDGSREYQQDAYGYQIPNTPSNIIEPKDGADIYLTIDNTIQLKLETAVKDLTEKFDMSWLTLTVADAKTGAILGTASAPSFDPNTLDIHSYLTPLTQYAYEPGSTMKVYSFMAAMENGVYNGSELYQSGSLKIGDITINDFNNVGWGVISFDDGFAYSSNIAAAKLAQKMGKNALMNFYKKLGFGSKTGIELPDENAGTINFKYDIEIASASFGQGITTTPIQNIQALTTIANDGMMLRPYIVSKIVDSNSDEILYKGGRTEIEKVVSSASVDKIRSLMYDVVYSDKTTAKYYKPKTISMIGKTGTAQIASKSGGYLSGEYNYIRSFAGLFPAEDPQYIIYISVKQLVGSLRTVANTVANIVDDIASYKNIVEVTNPNSAMSLSSYINTDTETSVSLLENLGLNVIVIGNGTKVISQYPKVGTEVVKKEKIYLKTNGEEITIPNIIGWSTSEIKNYCNFVGLNCNYEGYGYVSESSHNKAKVTKEDTINIILTNKYDKYLTGKVEETEETQ